MLNGVVIGIYAYLWIHQLTGHGEIFGSVKANLSGPILKRGWYKIHKVLFDCAKCHAGQVAIWLFIFQAITIQDVVIAIFVAHYLECGKWK